MNRHCRYATGRFLLVLAAGVVLSAIAAPALAKSSADPAKFNVFLYVDTVNGTRPSGAKPRPTGCTQTNYFARGEQVVYRAWGSEAATGNILSTENVKYAYVKIPGLPNLKLNWGGHGAATNRVWFWANAFIVPKDYPLGTVVTQVVFKTESNTFGRFNYELQIVPNFAARKK
ncbi:MAG: hypothetical protein ACRDO9_02740 [Gaiellales bacterium]